MTVTDTVTVSDSDEHDESFQIMQISHQFNSAVHDH